MEKNEQMTDEPRFKTFPVRMTPKLNSALREEAFKRGVTVHQLVLRAIANELQQAN